MLRVLAASESLTIKEFAKSGNANARKWQAPDVSRRFDVVYVSLEWHQTVTLVHSAFNRIDFRRLFRRTNEAHTTTANNAGNTALNDEISARTLLSTVPPKATREQNCPRTAVRGTTNNSLGTLINPVDHRTRWMSCTQLVSQMTPCQARMLAPNNDVGVILDQMNRTRTGWPSNVPSAENVPTPSWRV
jgi:hypothetical protein